MISLVAARCRTAALFDPSLSPEERELRATSFLELTLAYLERSFQKGFDDYGMLERTLELDDVRGHADYQDLIARYRD